MKTNFNEKVRLSLFCDGAKYRDDLFVCVNGRRYNIKRGVEVEVPRFVADVVAHSINQDKATADFIARGGKN